MSYGFNVSAATVAAATTAVAAELDKVVEAQPVHQHDRAFAETAVASALAMASEPAEGLELRVSVSGSLSRITPDAEQFTGISFSVSIYQAPAASAA